MSCHFYLIWIIKKQGLFLAFFVIGKNAFITGTYGKKNDFNELISVYS
ncbi:hypothetical protein B4073_1193 [Bacillus subtilis]|uniref:Uncharacterized protein n=1 Tax=Bacillus subtilis subsp. subtilis TaxID=135461 RepID=A0ABD3ZSY7_BACIU|nr:hypothetical protein B4067_1366 [Bacillus subtilis subsp. subtilis]KIN38235.1 hypothetical protein B4068_1202 [Bacillus subtilis]KIN54381.1 hypothetical protein B4073_1193 [Bacillus subtilis]KIN58252.1 hypothetical protein B4145_1315 [Bacillus subtilis]